MRASDVKREDGRAPASLTHRNGLSFSRRNGNAIGALSEAGDHSR